MTPPVHLEAPEAPLSALPLDCVLHGDCLDVLRGLPDACVDAVVTDPPYGLGAAPDMLEVLQAWLAGDAYTPRGKGGFMGKAWDAFIPGPEYWREVLRVLKPGGHALVFAGTRTWDVMGLALRLAGFEIRDTCQWLYGSGFPKSLDVGKQLDKAAGAHREVTGHAHGHVATNGGAFDDDAYQWQSVYSRRDKPATDAAQAWDGWGTALKPAWEPIIVCRKPLAASTVAANVLAHGTGALNIGASRVAGEAQKPFGVRHKRTTDGQVAFTSRDDNPEEWQPHTAGRWPANLLLSHSIWCAPDACVEGCPVAELDAQSGVSRSSVTHGVKRSNGVLKYAGTNARPSHGVYQRETDSEGFGDTGGASRYFQVFSPSAVDYCVTSPYNDGEGGSTCQETPHGADSTMAAGIASGANQEAASSTSSLNTAGSGSKPTGRSQKATKSTTSTTTRPTTDSTTSNSSRRNGTTTTTSACERITGSSTVWSSADAPDATSTSRSTSSASGEQEPITATASLAQLSRSESGDMLTLSVSESASENTTPPLRASDARPSASMSEDHTSLDSDRYFPTFRYQAKASRSERNRGCEMLEARANRINAPRASEGENFSPSLNSHPTVKPLALMSWLITLITPSGGVVLDPFTGSGSTLCAAKAGGWRYVGIEREAEYVAIAQARLAATLEPSLGSAVAIEQPQPAKPTRKPRKAPPVEPLWEIRA